MSSHQQPHFSFHWTTHNLVLVLFSSPHQPQTFVLAAWCFSTQLIHFSVSFLFLFLFFCLFSSPHLQCAVRSAPLTLWRLMLFHFYVFRVLACALERRDHLPFLQLNSQEIFHSFLSASMFFSLVKFFHFLMLCVLWSCHHHHHPLSSI